MKAARSKASTKMTDFSKTGLSKVFRLSAILLVLCTFLFLGCEEELTSAYEQDGGDVVMSDQAYSATETDESAVWVYNEGTFELTDSTIAKTGDASDVNASNFYGTNAAVLAEDGSAITLSNCDITSDAEGANAVFAYGEGSSVTVDNCAIETTGSSSRGVDGTYGGTITVTNTTITTQGDHCAALASDRYENNDPPVINADNCIGETAGQGSPGIYCTGTFNVSNSQLTATGSEAAVIEGLNSITLTDSDIAGAVKWGVMIYQSMSGDSSVGTGTFRMSGGSLTNNATGPDFFVCNTTGVIELDNVDIISSGDTLISAEAPSADNPNTNTDWGDGGGIVTFTATNQILDGHIFCDAASSIDLTLSDSSNLNGTVDAENEGDVSLTLDESSSWTATADSYISNLSGVVLSGSTPTNVDAAQGVVIQYSGLTNADGNTLDGTYSLASGGILQPNE